MRIEDFDGPRIQAGASDSAIEILQWLGLDWDGEPLVQSRDHSIYMAAMTQLAESGLTYRCNLSRKEISTGASAPNEGDQELRFPDNLRPENAGRPCQFNRTDGTHWRFITRPGHSSLVKDSISGIREFEPAAECGDFVVWTVRDEPAYQLAVVVDDIRQGVTDVVRGDDLLPSAARQQLLYSSLQATPPRWWHMPLVRGEDGRRLAKRHGDTRLDRYRAEGVPPQKILGLVAWWCGLVSTREAMDQDELLGLFDHAKLPSEDVIFTVEDEKWLTT